MNYSPEKNTKRKLIAPKGVKLWNEAKKVIPGASQLLSKRSEMFLPDQWPSYYKKAKGVEIWDLDGNKFIDMSLMGIGACVLGYADKDVDSAVKKAINKCTMTTLNCYEEVTLAQMLIKMHPWAGKVRYARTGGEAVSIAVRIARAFTGKDKIAFCGYHGWSDWYLAANLANDKSLDGHLIPGLDPKGVPRSLKGTALPFNYNNIDELKKIVQENPDLGVIILEPIRYQEPQQGFLEEVTKIAKDIGAVLIFDEITSGWRLNCGGAYQKYNVTPDIVVYGKALGNGYPISVILGKSEIMDAAQTSFISSTFWTERIGPTAALATLKKIISKNVPEHLINTGKRIKEEWRESAKRHNLEIKIMGIDPLATFHFEYGDQSQAIHTLFTQEMLKRGFLASKQVYVSFAHTEEIVNLYIQNLDEVFSFISKAIESGNVHNLLEGPIAHTGFKRLA